MLLFSIQSLPKGLRDYFELLVVLKRDIEISPDVLEIIWDMDNYDTEDCLTRKFRYVCKVSLDIIASNPFIVPYSQKFLPEENNATSSLWQIFSPPIFSPVLMIV